MPPTSVRESQKSDREVRDYMTSQATQGPGKMKAGAEMGSVDSDSDSNENTAALEQPVKKARMELQVASSSKRITPFENVTGSVPPHVIDSAEFRCSTAPKHQL
ncbi:hypothetical protein AZE42_04606 [Rhizopogon vesiculosus]|uniref:Uncharacterized protein n=1 Tax=Rhizopogon vesiculosus TaxID=180088 RepID=A0A1J8PZX6_9AGAM|nr:hypothetical protein AZE42_04606 [Rhizopogon vesiculosus]